MNFAHDPDDDDPDDDLDDEAWDDEDSEIGDDSDDEPTVPCPACRREILEDSPRCPWCGRYLSAEDHAAVAGKPAWVILTAVICLAMVIWWMIWR